MFEGKQLLPLSGSAVTAAWGQVTWQSSGEALQPGADEESVPRTVLRLRHAGLVSVSTDAPLLCEQIL